MSGRAALDAGEISAMLARSIDRLVLDIVPAGRKDGHEWRAGSVAGEAGTSLSVRLTGGRAGVWCDFATGLKGDALDLVAHAQCRGSLPEARKWGMQWLGLNSASGPAPLTRCGAAPPASPRAMQAAADDDAVKRLERTARLWSEGVPIAETPGAAYVRHRGVQPHPVLRFHPSCPSCDGKRYPAVLAPMTDPVTGEFCGVHRTFIQPDGSGKADTPSAKQMLGRAGVVRLQPDDDLDLGLGVAEGIETALSVQQRLWAGPMWACLTAGAIARLPVIRGIEALSIFADTDPSGAGMTAAKACAERWIEGGCSEVRIIPPPGLKADWNDLDTLCADYSDALPSKGGRQ